MAASKYTIKFEVSYQLFTMFLFIFSVILILVLISDISLLNTSYMYFVGNLENMENNGLDEIIKLDAYKQQLIFEIGKTRIKKYKKFINLSAKNTDFIGQIKDIDGEVGKTVVDEHTELSEKEAKGRIRRIIEGYGADDDSNADKVIAYSFGFLRSIYSWENPVGKNRGEEDFLSSVFFEYKGNVYLYPGYKANNSFFNKENYMENKENLYGFLKDKWFNYSQFIYKYNESTVSEEEKKKIMQENPVPFIEKIADFNFEYPTSKLPPLNSETASPKDKIMVANFDFNSENPSDFYSVNLNENALIDYFYDNIFSLNFIGTFTVTTFNNDKIVYNLPCYYMQYLHFLYNLSSVMVPDKEFNASKYNITDIFSCLSYPKAKRIMHHYYIDNKEGNYKYYSRKIRTKLYQSGNTFKTVSKLLGMENLNLSFKIIYIQIPLISGHLLISENGKAPKGGFSLGIYLFKDLSNPKTENNKVYYKFYGFVLFQLLLFLLIWFMFLLFSYCSGKRLLNVIFLPVENLIYTFKNFNTNKKEFDVNKITSEMNYEYDNDINNLFQQCRNMLLGRFITENDDSQRNLNVQKKKFNDNLFSTYNNISFIKSNNLSILNDGKKINKEQNENDFIDQNIDEIMSLCTEEERKRKVKYDYKKEKQEQLFDDLFKKEIV